MTETIPVYIVAPDPKHQVAIAGVFKSAMHGYAPVFIVPDEISHHKNAIVLSVETDDKTVSIKHTESDISRDFVMLMHKNVEEHNKRVQLVENYRRHGFDPFPKRRTPEEIAAMQRGFADHQIYMHTIKSTPANISHLSPEMQKIVEDARNRRKNNKLKVK